jgi:hypothetical protein
VIVLPAIVSVPVRGDVDVFTAMSKATAPLPLPLAPAVMVNQLALLVALQLQPAEVVTPARLDPAVAETFTDVGATLNVHGAPCWFTVIVRPATVNVPVRGPAVFAAMSNVTVPLPVALPPEVIVNHEALLVAVQLHGVVTLAELDPAVAGGLSVVGVTVDVQELPP